MQVTFDTMTTDGSGTLVLFCDQAGALTPFGTTIDAAVAGLVLRGLALAPAPLGQGKTVHVVLPPTTGLDFERVLVVGVGDVDALDEPAALAIGASLAKVLADLRLERICIAADFPGAAAWTEPLLAGLLLRTYRFAPFKTTEADGKLDVVVVKTAHGDALRARLPGLEARVAGVHRCRDLVNMPANRLDTDAFVAAARELVDLGVEVEVLDRDRMATLGMGALLGVAQGSRMPPYVVLMRWSGAGDDRAPLALVGKGVVFDSGGLSLKPAKSMETMKCDMAGAACVVGTMLALARRGAKANVVGAIGLVENMPSSTAQRPGDIVRAMAGKTIEVLNTDAEGRLVLADLLWYVRDRFKPEAMIDFATLTGAIIVALGDTHAGLFTNDDTLGERLLAAGKETGETVWRMPLGAPYHRQLESSVADLKNIGRPGQAGATVAACFLEAFVGEAPWAHIDLAATSFTESEDPLAGKGGTGWGVRLIDRLVATRYEV